MFDHHPDSWELSLACLALGVILGMIAALKVAYPILLGMRRQIDELERDRILRKD